MGERKRLTEEELAAQQGEPLPNREVMSVITSEPQPMPPVGGGDDIHIHPIEGERIEPIKDPPVEGGGGEPMPVIYDEGGEPQPVIDDSSGTQTSGAYFDETSTATSPSEEGAGGPDRGPEPA